MFKWLVLKEGYSFHLLKMYLTCICVSHLALSVSQGSDTDLTGSGEKAESSRYSRSYTSGATLGAELRRGRSRRLSSSLQVPNNSMGTQRAFWVGGRGCVASVFLNI